MRAECSPRSLRRYSTALHHVPIILIQEVRRLEKHSLAARGLTCYKLLADNIYVHGRNRTVQSISLLYKTFIGMPGETRHAQWQIE